MKLGIAGISVSLGASDRGEPFATNIVRLWELNPPRGEEPIDWLLMTSDPISTAEELATVVDYHRGRWMIEEYFKSLKSGCIFEKRQLESLHTLTVALGACIPIAWRLLLVRAVARGAPLRLREGGPHQERGGPKPPRSPCGHLDRTRPRTQVAGTHPLFRPQLLLRTNRGTASFSA